MAKNVVGKGRMGLLVVYILSFIAVLLWGMSYIWSNTLMSLEIPVEYFVFVRIVIAGIFLLVFNIVMGENIKIKRGDMKLFLLLSMFEPFIYFVCETHGIRLTESPTYSALIVASTPIFSVIAGLVIFKERFNILNMIGILICLGGIVMVTLCASQTGDKFIWGVILLVIAVLAEVGHASCTKFLSDGYKPQVIVMYQFLIGSIYLLPLFLTRGLDGFEMKKYLSWDVMGPIVCLSILCSSIAFSLWANTIKHLGVAKSSIFLAMIPVVTAVAGWMLGQESLLPLQWLGIAVSCIGVVMSQYVFKKKKHKYYGRI